MSLLGWVRRATGVSRRDFLRAGGMGVVGLTVAEGAVRARVSPTTSKSCIFVLMTGGASQLETFDPKPEAPSSIRGPFRAIQTSVPGLQLSETLPRLAQRASQFALVRSLHHEAAPIHETGQQLLQTGRLARGDVRFPSYGAVVARTLGSRGAAPAYVVLPQLVAQTGVNAYRGQGAGLLGPAYEPAIADSRWDDPSHVSDDLLRSYGDNRFGRLLLEARQLVETGTRCVTVNLFDTLQRQRTWDCHGNRADGPARLQDYGETLCPQFDRALAALLDDLALRGMLDETLVVAVGEFGRTPRVNEHGGRDHWPGVWSALLAGGGVRGGQVIGASDSSASSPIDRPVAPAELVATVFRTLGLDPASPLPDAMGLPLADAAPIDELFG